MARIAPRSPGSVLGAATAPPTWVGGVALTGLRLLVGLLWLWNGLVARRLLAGWGVVLGLIGIIAMVVPSDEGFRAPDGDLVGSWDLEVGVGTYNMLAALILLSVAVLMLAGALLCSRILAVIAGMLALAAAVSIYVQWGRTEIWLGASATTAAVFVCAAIVVAATAKPLSDR